MAESDTTKTNEQTLEQLSIIFEEVISIATSIEESASALISQELSDRYVIPLTCSIESLAQQIGLLSELGHKKASGSSYFSIKGGIESHLLGLKYQQICESAKGAKHE